MVWRAIGKWANMARGALGSGVFSSQGIFCRVVVELSFFPLERRMARGAFLAEIAFVLIVEAMAGLTAIAARCSAERCSCVAFRTGDLQVFVFEGELCLVMVKRCFLPAGWGVTGFALFAECAFVFI